MNKKEMDYLHELKMQELAYERETELIKIEHHWKMENYQQPQQYPHYPQHQQLPQPPMPPAPEYQEPQTIESQSQKKYGGKKNG